MPEPHGIDQMVSQTLLTFQQFVLTQGLETRPIPRFVPINNKEYGIDRATKEVWQEVTATYYGMISRVDWQFGRVVNQTKAQGLWNNTVTIFFTDHGTCPVPVSLAPDNLC